MVETSNSVSQLQPCQIKEFAIKPQTIIHKLAPLTLFLISYPNANGTIEFRMSHYPQNKFNTGLLPLSYLSIPSATYISKIVRLTSRSSKKFLLQHHSGRNLTRGIQWRYSQVHHPPATLSNYNICAPILTMNTQIPNLAPLPGVLS